MKIKKGDNVIMLQGKDRGKRGKVMFVLKDSGRVVVEGLNMVKKHQKAKKQGQKGQIVHKERAIDVSNAQVICSKCGKAAKISYQLVGENKVRICRKCKGEI